MAVGFGMHEVLEQMRETVLSMFDLRLNLVVLARSPFGAPKNSPYLKDQLKSKAATEFSAS